MLERSKQEMQVGRARLLPHALANNVRQRPPAGAGEPGLPFAVAAIEQQQCILVLEPEHVKQVIRLGAVERNRKPFSQRGIEIDARGAEIVVRHALITAAAASQGPVYARRRGFGEGRRLYLDCLLYTSPSPRD